MWVGMTKNIRIALVSVLVLAFVVLGGGYLYTTGKIPGYGQTYSRSNTPATVLINNNQDYAMGKTAAARGDYDLSQHAKASGTALVYFDEATKRKYVPHVIEPAVGEVSFYDVSHAREAMAAGILAAKRGIPKAKESLILFALPRLWRQWTSAR